MNTTREDLLDHVKSTAEGLSIKTDILDVEYRTDVNLNLKNIILTVTVGGPRVDVDLGHHTIKGYWGGETVDYPIFETETDTREAMDQLWDLYEQQFDIELNTL